MKKIIHIALFILFSVAVTSLMGFIYVKQGNKAVKDLIINIKHHGEKGYLDNELVSRMINVYDSIPHLNINQVKTSDIEALIDKNPFVKRADAFINVERELVINIEEKRAILRIFNQNGSGFYIDDEGNIFPLSNNYTPRVMIVNGYINIKLRQNATNINDSVYKNTCLADLFHLTEMINQNKFLKAQISEIYVNSLGEFDLIPQLGNHLIKFGKMENARIKLNNLDIFYRKALIGEGWNKYETINLKYKNQVVCKRK